MFHELFSKQRFLGRTGFLSCLFLVGLLMGHGSVRSQILRIATVNVWSGLDYNIGWSVGEYESEEKRDVRFHLLVEEVQKESIDIIAVQEVNPVCRFSHRLAYALGYDEIHQACNSGLKIFGAGVPTNFHEGIAILAHPRLQLKYSDVFKISGSFGFHGDLFSFHFDEASFALVGKILVDSIPIYIANIHLPVSLPGFMNDTVRAWLNRGILGEEDSTCLMKQREERAKSREEDFKKFLTEFEERYREKPVVLSGDFNAEPQSAEISMIVDTLKYLDAHQTADNGNEETWSFQQNHNISFSVRDTFEGGQHKSSLELLDAAYDKIDRRIDYIFLNHFFDNSAVVHSRIFLDKPRENIFVSDHFGVLTQINLSNVAWKVKSEFSYFTSVANSSIEGFPIITYDTDVGFGYGAKGFLLNLFGWSESIDVTAFNSVKVERWYRFTFSVPDFEHRQGKTYPLAVDLIVDYDKYLVANLFPPGNMSNAHLKETYTRKLLELALIANRGFRPTLAGQIGARFKSVNNVGFFDSGIVQRLPRINVGRSTMLSLFGNLRFDTRDSYINPQRGVVLQGELEGASDGLLSDFNFFRTSITAQYFTTLFYPLTVFAARTILQQTSGGDVPLYVKSALGGNNTLRGFPLDRFIDNGVLLVNTELRFPIIGRLKGVTFFDLGQVWSSISKVGLRAFHTNPGIGLRYVMDTFVVRLDVGFSRETTGLYFNFGHAF